MNIMNKFKISNFAYTSGVITSTVVYFSLTHTGEITAYIADNSIKTTGMIGSNVIKIMWGNFPSAVSTTMTDRLAEFVKTNIKVGGEMTALSTSLMAGFFAILLTTFLEFSYMQTKTYLIKNTCCNKYFDVNYINFSSDTVDDFEFISLK